MKNQFSKILVVCNKDALVLSRDGQEIIVAATLQRLCSVQNVVAPIPQPPHNVNVDVFVRQKIH